MISEEDSRMIQYFWEEKGDIERWTSWKDKLPSILEEAPELVVAWNNYKIATRTLTTIIKGLVYEQL